MNKKQAAPKGSQHRKIALKEACIISCHEQQGNNSHHPDRRGKCGRRQAASVCDVRNNRRCIRRGRITMKRMLTCRR